MEAAEDGAGSFRNPGGQGPFSDCSQKDVKTMACTSSCKGTLVTSVDHEKTPTCNKSGGGLKEEIVEVVIGNAHGSSSSNECNKEESDDDSLKEKEPENVSMKVGEPENDSINEGECNDSTKEGEQTDDGYLYCEECETYFYNKCEVHGPALFIPDTPVPMGVEDRPRQTLPPGLVVRTSDIPDAGLGVFNMGETVSIGAHFGPYQGDLVEREEAMNSGYSWVICRRSQCEEYIDAMNETNSNWMRYVNCARNEEEQNLVAFQYLGGIFYRCCRPIRAGQELLMWYQEHYAKEIGITFEYLWNKKCFTKENKDPSLSCPFCPLHFSAQTYLQTHISRCQTYLAQQGPEELGSFQALETHRRVHTEARYRCSQCGKSCSNRGNLQRHLLIHSGEKPHQCSHCEKSFSQKTHLEVHQTVHTGARPYPCPACGKQFTRPSALRKHGLVHGGMKPHRCSHCWKSFTNQSALHTHMSVHASQKPYQCSQCGNSYTLKSTLQLHQRVHAAPQS